LNGDVKASNLQTGVYSGPVGSPYGQHRFSRDCLVREENIEALNTSIYNRSHSDKENGAFYYFLPTNVVLQRNASFTQVIADTWYLCLMITVQLPFKNNDKAMRMLCKMLPKEVEELIAEWDHSRLHAAFELVHKQNKIREWLNSSDVIFWPHERPCRQSRLQLFPRVAKMK
jgi:hypothetical protein